MASSAKHQPGSNSNCMLSSAFSMDPRAIGHGRTPHRTSDPTHFALLPALARWPDRRPASCLLPYYFCGRWPLDQPRPPLLLASGFHFHFHFHLALGAWSSLESLELGAWRLELGAWSWSLELRAWRGGGRRRTATDGGLQPAEPAAAACSLLLLLSAVRCALCAAGNALASGKSTSRYISKTPERSPPGTGTRNQSGSCPPPEVQPEACGATSSTTHREDRSNQAQAPPARPPAPPPPFLAYPHTFALAAALSPPLSPQHRLTAICMGTAG
jgi:hypothetical protein